MFVHSTLRRQPIQILHLAYTRFPADSRVKRETAVLRDTGRSVAVIALRGPGERAVERRDGILIIRVPGRKSRGGVMSYLAEYADFVWQCRRLVASHRALRSLQLVHVHTLPDFLLWAALPARRRGARVVFDMHEIFPEFVASRFQSSLGRLVMHVARLVERWARRRADLTITVNRPIQELLSTRPIGRPERCLVLHNTADPADFGHGPSDSTEAPNAPLELVYHGTLTALYGLEVAIRAVHEVRGRGLAPRFTILGDGPERDALQRLAAKLGLADAVAFETPIPQQALPARLRRCAAGIVPTRLDGMTRYSLSTKLLEYVHLGIPALAARLPTYRRYFGEEALWYWTPGDAHDLARVIGDFAAAPASERMRRVRLAREAIAPFAWPMERQGLLAAYADLLGPFGNRSDSTAVMRSAALPSP